MTTIIAAMTKTTGQPINAAASNAGRPYEPRNDNEDDGDATNTNDGDNKAAADEDNNAATDEDDDDDDGDS